MFLADRCVILKMSALVGVLLAIGSLGCSGRGAVLRGFVVADAHIGWRHAQQPRPEETHEAMERITKRFDGLDVFLDVGDAHHGTADRLTERWLGQWTDIIAGGCGPIPFYYTAGNHEIDTWHVDYDVERRCARLGSVSARPYYSFDIKGIHFISLPQLLFMSYVSKESLDWVKLDLELNKDKSVIFLTHNSVKGTTEYHDDPGYRRLANSDEILELFDRYPNVLAWMHGHNHTYEVVENADRLFVSCGRIGGFNPPYEEQYGEGNLGGMYFEVGPGHITVRGYSATKEMFLDEMGQPQHSKTLRTETSFDPEAPASVSYGHGGAIDGQRMPVFHHHVSAGGAGQLFIAGADGPVINENPDFAVYTERTHPRAPNPHILPGYRFVPHDDTRWEWLDPGLRIRKVNDTTTMVAPGPDRGRRSYYCCSPGKTLRLITDLESTSGGQTLQLCWRVHDRNFNRVASVEGPVWKLAAGRQSKQADFQIPDLEEVASIYTDPASDNVFHVLIEAVFSNLSDDVVVKRFALTFADAAGLTADPAVTIDGKSYTHRGKLAPGRHATFDLPSAASARSVYEFAAKGNRRLAWLVRQPQLTWQVRNAAVTDRGDHLEIGPLRNTFTLRKEVVIAPMKPTKLPYVHRLRNVNGARIYPWNRDTRQLKVEVLAVLGPAEIEIITGRKPRRVTGADSWVFKDGHLVLSINSPGIMIVKY